MRIYLLSDNVDTLMGLRMSGVEGVVLHEEYELRLKLAEVLEDESIAVILITEKLISLMRETINELKLSRRQPLIVEIPDRHGNGCTKGTITKYVKEAVGITLN